MLHLPTTLTQKRDNHGSNIVGYTDADRIGAKFHGQKEGT